MSMIRGLLVTLALVLCPARGTQATPAESDSGAVGSYKVAPPAETLDRQTRERLRRRRWIVGILVGSTLVGGAIGSWSRRRHRRGQRLEETDP